MVYGQGGITDRPQKQRERKRGLYALHTGWRSADLAGSDRWLRTEAQRVSVSCPRANIASRTFTMRSSPNYAICTVRKHLILHTATKTQNKTERDIYKKIYIKTDFSVPLPAIFIFHVLSLIHLSSGRLGRLHGAMVMIGMRDAHQRQAVVPRL